MALTCAMPACGGTTDRDRELEQPAWRRLELVGVESGPRVDHAAVWTGEWLLVWGGAPRWGELPQWRTDGLLIDVETGRAVEIPSPEGLAPLTEFVWTWTGSEFVVWGTDTALPIDLLLPAHGGARYSVADRTWRPLATEGQPWPRGSATGCATTSELYVWGGVAWDPADSNMLGAADAQAYVYDLDSDAWRQLPADGVPEGVMEAASVCTGAQFIVWGGVRANGSSRVDSGAAYDSIQQRWIGLPSEGAPAARSEHRMAWTGRAALVLGGYVLESLVEPPVVHEAAYWPDEGRWTTMARPVGLGGRPELGVGVMSSGIVAYGGRLRSIARSSAGGAYYDLASDTWTPLPVEDAPPPLEKHSMTVTPAGMVIWGGMTGDGDELSAEPESGWILSADWLASVGAE